MLIAEPVPPRPAKELFAEAIFALSECPYADTPHIVAACSGRTYLAIIPGDMRRLVLGTMARRRRIEVTLARRQLQTSRNIELLTMREAAACGALLINELRAAGYYIPEHYTDESFAAGLQSGIIEYSSHGDYLVMSIYVHSPRSNNWPTQRTIYISPWPSPEIAVVAPPSHRVQGPIDYMGQDVLRVGSSGQTLICMRTGNQIQYPYELPLTEPCVMPCDLIFDFQSGSIVNIRTGKLRQYRELVCYATPDELKMYDSAAKNHARKHAVDDFGNLYKFN